MSTELSPAGKPATASSRAASGCEHVSFSFSVFPTLCYTVTRELGTLFVLYGMRDCQARQRAGPGIAVVCEAS